MDVEVVIAIDGKVVQFHAVQTSPTLENLSSHWLVWANIHFPLELLAPDF